MRARRRSFIAAAVSLLAGCGGGGEPEEEVGAIPGEGETDLSGLQSALVATTGTTQTLDAICASARHAIVWGDAAGHSGMFAPNRAHGGTPTRNVLAFSTGPLMNESGSVMPVKTNNYLTWSDPEGVSFATRLQSSGAQLFYFHRSVTCPALPSGLYGLRFRCRSTPGTADQVFRYGLSTGLVAGTASDLDWSQAGNVAATTFSVQFNYSGSGDIAIRLPVGGMDILIDRVQLYFGGLDAIPSWTLELAGLHGGRKGFSFPGAIAADVHGNWSQAADSGGGWILEPGLADHVYDRGVTVMHACALDGLDAASRQTLAYAVSTRNDPRLGTSLGTLHVGFETNSSPYEGQVKFAPCSAFRAQASFQALGHGMLVLGQAAGPSGRRMFVNEIPVLTEKTTMAPFTVNCWHVGSATTAGRAHITDFETVGRHGITLIWDRELSNEEWAAASLVVQGHFARRGGADFPDFHVFSGDSNWTKGTGDAMQLLSQHGALSPGRNLWARDTSVGGTGIAEVYGSKPFPAPMDPYGRLLATEVPMMLAALRAGRKVVYHLLWGTNDFTEICGSYAWGIAAYNETRKAVVEYLIALHPNLWVQEYTIVAAGSGSGRWYQPGVREEVNRLRRADWAARKVRTVRHRLCDLGASKGMLGSQAIADAGTYLLEPAPGGVHFNRAGDQVAAAIVNQNLVALRAAMHVSP
jgi:hypothetical protein